MAILPLCSILTIFNQYHFLISQEKTYFDDTKNKFIQENDLNVIFDEIGYLLREHEVISKRIPKSINLGLFKVDSSEYFNKIL